MSNRKITLGDLVDAINLCIESGCSSDTEIVRIDPSYNEIYLPGVIIPKRTLESISIQLPLDGNPSCIQIEKGVSYIE